jgi:hypothetical protein
MLAALLELSCWSLLYWLRALTGTDVCNMRVVQVAKFLQQDQIAQETAINADLPGVPETLRLPVEERPRERSKRKRAPTPGPSPRTTNMQAVVTSFVRFASGHPHYTSGPQQARSFTRKHC